MELHGACVLGHRCTCHDSTLVSRARVYAEISPGTRSWVSEPMAVTAAGVRLECISAMGPGMTNIAAAWARGQGV